MSKLLVIGMLAIAVLVVGGVWLYLGGEGGSDQLAKIECTALLPTAFELQGKRVTVTRDQTCRVLKAISTMTPIEKGFDVDESDPWHYFGRMRVLPKSDVWFLVFVARRSDGFRPRVAVHHRRGAGWASVGQFDAAPVLRELGVEGSIDTALLKSDSSLKRTDWTTSL